MTQPLKNKTILITRDEKQSAGLIRKIKKFGGRELRFPTIKISAPQEWEDCDRAIKNINDFNWIIFTSANGVRSFFERAIYLNAEIFRGMIAVIGAKTLQVLQSFGLPANIVPHEYSAAGLLKAFEGIDLRGQKILIPTSDIARNELQKGLEKAEAKVEIITAYRTVCHNEGPSQKIRDALKCGEVSAILFFSPSAVDCFINLIGNQMVEKIIEYGVVIAAIGPTTTTAIERAGLKVSIAPHQSTEESMVEALIRYFETRTETELN